ncbi:MAG: hypothetical protein V4492_09025 [Chlamydiota bacterium]
MRFIGITLENNPQALKAAILKKEGGAISIESLEESPASVKPFYNLGEVHITSALSGSQVFIRSLQLPLTDKGKILAALPFQCEAILPFPLESSVICPQIKQIDKQTSSATLYATTQSSLQRHISALKELQIDCDAISCEPVALARFAHWQFPKVPKILSFHTQNDALLYTLSYKGEILFSQTLLLKEKSSLAIELQKLEIFLKERGMIDEHTPWLSVGDGDVNAFTGEQLLIEDLKIRSYALAIGLGLDAIANDSLTIQFSKAQFTPPHTQKKRKKLLLTYLGICCLATLLVAGASTLFVGKKQRVLVERLKEELPKEIIITPSASIEAVEESLYAWEAALNKQKSSFPFHPTVPKVSDVLSWLSADPHFTSEDGDKKEGIEIQSIHYQLIKYPKIGEAGAPYTATLAIDFNAETPRLARDFHEELLKGSPLVNNKKEIRWQVQNQNYHTSFELGKGVSP